LCSFTSARRLHHNYDDYLCALEVSGVKLEYCEGEIYAMAGEHPRTPTWPLPEEPQLNARGP
jgi:hypothetical protein